MFGDQFWRHISFFLRYRLLIQGVTSAVHHSLLVSWEVSFKPVELEKKKKHIFESSMLGKTRPFLNVMIRSHPTETYGWWKKFCTTWDG